MKPRTRTPAPPILVKCRYKDCNVQIPNRYGERGVSLSRFDNASLICSICGTREAFGEVTMSMLAGK